MTEQEFYKQLKEQQRKLYSIDISGKEIENEILTKVLINRLEKINPFEWVDNKQIRNHLDIRLQLFLRIESAVVHYYQSIKSTLRDIEGIWKDTKDLGYLNQFVYNTITFREVSLRTSFLEKIFFEVDYFIQQMNVHLQFHTDNSIHKKQQYFQKLLDKLSIGNEHIEVFTIIDDLNSNIQNKNFNELFVKNKNRKVLYREIYTYLVALRNTFHNNGYAQKTLNKMDIGGVKFEIVKDKQCLISHDVVFMSAYLITIPLLSIVEKTFDHFPNQYWEDKYTREIKDFAEKRERERNANKT